ncbi:MFS transporter asaE [Penicillium cinerascens]|uniref:MFS transporter asaE n=1 Tax=Penicillium cinerascens TaxID=70096 RepID=A0A9W9TB02_9EURO|nr:MFS transporter asaE [Penicillium cinerascens]KAJ5215886.1 MFS transporter asaE [Penicillium cinerascens]
MSETRDPSSYSESSLEKGTQPSDRDDSETNPRRKMRVRLSPRPPRSRAEYQMNQLRDYSSSQVGWISSVLFFFMLGVSPLAGRLYDGYGPRLPIMIGSFLHVFGLMMTSLSTKYYQLILSQSVCSWFGSSLIITPAMTTKTYESIILQPTTYFHDRRALAGGFAIAGSSLGGVIFPFMVNHLLSAIGFAWTMRACAFLILGLLFITCTLISSNVTHTPKEFKLSSYLSPLRECNFLLLCIVSFFMYWGMFVPQDKVCQVGLSCFGCRRFYEGAQAEAQAHLYDWLKIYEPSWGYTIYRTTYTAQSDAAFPAMVDLITAYLKDGFYEQYQSLRENPRTADQANEAVFDELWAAHKPRVMDDAAQVDGASIDQLRARFEVWAEERDMADRFPSYRMFIVVDEESFETLQTASIPAECPGGMEHLVAYYVKLVEAWQDQDRDSLFPGWMKCSLHSLWDIWRHMQDGDYMRHSYMMVREHRDVY